MSRALALRPYRHGDFDEIEPREDFAREHAAMGWPLRTAPPEGFAWTVTRDGAPIGCGGYRCDRRAAQHSRAPIWRGWLYLSRLRRAEWGFVLSAARRTLAFADREGGVDIEASALVCNAAAIRTLEKLGFDYETGDFTYDDQAYVRLVRRF